MNAAQRLVLDSWPVLEWIYGKEPAASHFEAVLARIFSNEVEAFMSRITLGEIVYNLRRHLSPSMAARALADFETFPIHIVSVRDEQLDRAADWKSSSNISYADAFVVALAASLNAPILTGDPELRVLHEAGQVQVEWLGA